MATTIQALAAAITLIASSAAHAQEAVQWRVQDGGNGHWYLPITTPVTRPQALRQAAALGGHLATITSSAENQFLASLNLPSLEGAISYWTGGIRTESGYGPWSWITDEAWSYSDFDVSEPNGCCGIDVRFTTFRSYVGHQGRWDDTSYENAQFVLVEFDADCTGDGIVDYGQILDGSYLDSDLDGVPDTCEAPEGSALVADSHADFSSVQGERGWFYEFDRGPGTGVAPMGYFVACDFPDEILAWCTRSAFGTPGSYCHLGRQSSSTSTSFDCSSASAGLERPRRRWASVSPVSGSLALTGRFYSIDGFLARISVIVDGQTAFVIDSTASDTFLDPTIINVILPINDARSVVVLEDPLDGSCHSDGARYRLRLFGNDCDSDGLADAIEIDAGSADDDEDGVPDVCEVDPCPGDITNGGTVDATDLSIVLAAWGTNGQGEFQADIDDSGLVDGGDLALVLGGWGLCPR